MYRTPFASLRVPDIDDVDMPQGLIDLATDIQWRAESNAARLAEVKRRRGCYVESTSQTINHSSLTALSWVDTIYDTDGYVNIPSFPTRITVPRGVYLVTAGTQFSGTGNLNTAYLQIYTSVWGTVSVTQTGPISTPTASLTTSGILYSPAGEYITVNCYQMSSVGAGTIFGGTAKVAKIGNL